MVSIVLPNYNYASYLRTRIEGILSQTCQDFELIILDDASTDNSRNCIEQYRGHSKVAHIVYNETNSGSVFRQWNKGVALAKGEYVWIAEADDVAEPDFLERLVKILKENPKVGIAYCQSYRIDEKVQRTGYMLDWTADIDEFRWQKDFTGSGAVECAEYMILKNTIPNASAAVFRRDSFLRAGAAVEGMRLCGDWMTWVNMLLISDVAFVATPLNHYRRHSNSVQATCALGRQCEEEYQIKSHIVRVCQVSEKRRRRAATEAFEKWKLAIAYSADECGLAWMLRITHYVRRLQHPSAGSLWAAYLQRRWRYSICGRLFHFAKRSLLRQPPSPALKPPHES